MIRYTHIYVTGTAENGHPIRYYEGYFNTGDTKPTEYVSNGSNLINTDNGDWEFFNEKTSVWSKMTNIKGA